MFSKTEILAQAKDFLAKNPNGILEILGPTASGKTGFSIELAEFLNQKCGKNVEIISVDSRQVYRDCDISSAKITTAEMAGVPHHGLDIVNLDEPYSVVKFQAYCFGLIPKIQARGNIPVLCGGTALWLDAVSENYIFSEAVDERGQFKKSDQKSEPRWPVFKIGLHWDRESLYERLNARASSIKMNGDASETTITVFDDVDF